MSDLPPVLPAPENEGSSANAAAPPPGRRRLLWILAAVILVILLGAVGGLYLWSGRQEVLRTAATHMQNARFDMERGAYAEAKGQFQAVPKDAPQYATAQADATLAGECSAVDRLGQDVTALGTSFDGHIGQYWDDYSTAADFTNKSWQDFPDDPADARSAEPSVSALSGDASDLQSDFERFEALVGTAQEEPYGATSLASVVGPFRELAVDANSMSAGMYDEQQDLLQGSWQQAISDGITENNNEMPKVQADQTTVDGRLAQFAAQERGKLQQLLDAVKYN